MIVEFASVKVFFIGCHSVFPVEIELFKKHPLAIV